MNQPRITQQDYLRGVSPLTDVLLRGCVHPDLAAVVRVLHAEGEKLSSILTVLFHEGADQATLEAVEGLWCLLDHETDQEPEYREEDQ